MAPGVAALAVNGLLHASLSLLTGTYSPGTITGLVFWVPLGVFALLKGRQALSGVQFGAAVGLGLAIHALATATALSLG